MLLPAAGDWPVLGTRRCRVGRTVRPLWRNPGNVRWRTLVPVCRAETRWSCSVIVVATHPATATAPAAGAAPEDNDDDEEDKSDDNASDLRMSDMPWSSQRCPCSYLTVTESSYTAGKKTAPFYFCNNFAKAFYSEIIIDTYIL